MLGDAATVDGPGVTGGRQRAYRQSEVERLMDTRLWCSYGEVISSLRLYGVARYGLTPDGVRHLIEDFSRLHDSGYALTRDPEMLYRTLTGGR